MPNLPCLYAPWLLWSHVQLSSAEQLVQVSYLVRPQDVLVLEPLLGAHI